MDTALASKWDMFSLAFWSYAPHNLRHIRQPVPKDAPAPHAGSNIFTFEDAFEDLLAVSQGQALPDITMKHDQRKLLRQMFPGGEPVDFWLQRLRSQGLVASPNRFPTLSIGFPAWMTDNAEQARGSVGGGETDISSDEQSKHAWSRLLQDLGLANEEPRSKTFDHESAQTSNADAQRDQPDHFEELFSALESAVTGGRNSWDTFVKTFSEDNTQAKDDQPKQFDAAPGTKEVVKREEHVDRFGYLHSKVTIQTLDADGNQIGSETHYSMRPAPKESADTAHAAQEATDQHEDRPVKRVGWFWK
jgi:hypothetical protein